VTTRRVIIDHADINVPDLAEARQFYRAALAPLGREELADPHGGMSCGVEGLDHFGIYGDSEDRHHAHVAFEAPTRKLERDGQVLGTVRCSGGRTAVDVMVVWGLVDGGTVTAQADRVNPDRPGDPAGGDPALTVDLHGGRDAAVGMAGVRRRHRHLPLAGLLAANGCWRWTVRFLRTDTRLTD
jgi:catechol 2,3-dioxygenase-like lactoylglutathione lyase family enzyme